MHDRMNYKYDLLPKKKYIIDINEKFVLYNGKLSSSLAKDAC